MDPLTFSKAGGAGPLSLRKALRSLQQQIVRHHRKLANDPTSPSADHWRHEIARFQEALRQIERRLGHARS